MTPTLENRIKAITKAVDSNVYYATGMEIYALVVADPKLKHVQELIPMAYRLDRLDRAERALSALLELSDLCQNVYDEVMVEPTFDGRLDSILTLSCYNKQIPLIIERLRASFALLVENDETPPIDTTSKTA